MAGRDVDEQGLTAEVLRRLAATPDPRLRAVLSSLVEHLHAFVREVRVTEEEWRAGIDFLTETGRWCRGGRQEFILLSDTLGVSMLVDLVSHRRTAGATESTVLGPFFVEGAPEMPLGASIAAPGTRGDPCTVRATVAAIGGAPIAGAAVEVWQSDGEGFYDVQRAGGPNLRARFRADAAGRLWFRCVRPVGYPIPDDGPVGRMLRATARDPMRPPHLHFQISAPGFETLVTHLFVRGGEHLDSDPVFGVKESLVVPFRRTASGEYELEHRFVLEPERARPAP